MIYIALIFTVVGSILILYSVFVLLQRDIMDKSFRKYMKTSGNIDSAENQNTSALRRPLTTDTKHSDKAEDIPKTTTEKSTASPLNGIKSAEYPNRESPGKIPSENIDATLERNPTPIPRADQIDRFHSEKLRPVHSEDNRLLRKFARSTHPLEDHPGGRKDLLDHPTRDPASRQRKRENHVAQQKELKKKSDMDAPTVSPGDTEMIFRTRAVLFEDRSFRLRYDGTDIHPESAEECIGFLRVGDGTISIDRTGIRFANALEQRNYPFRRIKKTIFYHNCFVLLETTNEVAKVFFPDQLYRLRKHFRHIVNELNRSECKAEYVKG